ncbi:MAG: hypothetical protein IPK37_16520 [Austwickia sp.]|nr:MAG: hypothetical protein IPK37_16520 [Austwickia sp.]
MDQRIESRSGNGSPNDDRVPSGFAALEAQYEGRLAERPDPGQAQGELSDAVVAGQAQGELSDAVVAEQAQGELSDAVVAEQAQGELSDAVVAEQAQGELSDAVVAEQAQGELSDAVVAEQAQGELSDAVVAEQAQGELSDAVVAGQAQAELIPAVEIVDGPGDSEGSADDPDVAPGVNEVERSLESIEVDERVNKDVPTGEDLSQQNRRLKDAGHRPEWLRLWEGQKVHREYQSDLNEAMTASGAELSRAELYVHKPGVDVVAARNGANKRYNRVDWYDGSVGMIASMKNVQFSEVDSSIASRYIDELTKKYHSGVVIANVPTTPSALVHEELKGVMTLIVPSQAQPIPQKVIDYARDRNVIIAEWENVLGWGVNDASRDRFPSELWVPPPGMFSD